MSKKLERLVRAAQAENRIPALVAAVHRADRPLWTLEVGTSGTDIALSPGTLFRIGSITKTFTAVLVLQCRDDGLLDLDDPISAHLARARPRWTDHPAAALAHVRPPARAVTATCGTRLRSARRARTSSTSWAGPSGCCRQPGGSTTPTSASPCSVTLVERLRGGTWAEVLDDRILQPLGLRDVRTEPDERAAIGYLVDAYSDHARPEPPVDIAGVAAGRAAVGHRRPTWPAGRRSWPIPATVDPDGRVLAAVHTGRNALAGHDERRGGLDRSASGWASSSSRKPDRIVHVGHDGAMPGFLAGAYGRRGAGMPKAFGGGRPRLVRHRGRDGRAGPHPARHGGGATTRPTSRCGRRASLRPTRTGRSWVTGGARACEFVFSWHDGALRARGLNDPPGRPPAVFEVVSAGRAADGLRSGDRASCCG